MAVIPSNSWSKDDIIKAIHLYCVTPFGKIHKGNPDIMRLSEEIGRTPSSVAMKMANFAALDPTLEQKGMRNFSKLDKEAWDEFFNNLDHFLPESPLRGGAQNLEEEAVDFVYDYDGQTEILLTSKQRLKQKFFRTMVLSSYNYKCAITGIDNVELLVAGHIMPWALHVVSRLDPSNGLCLSALCDKAFDKGLIALDETYKLLVSSAVQQATRPHFEAYVGKPITLPNRFRPSQEFLSYHRSNVFRQ